MKKMMFAMCAVAAGMTVLAAEKKDLLTPPDVADRWKLEKYLDNMGLTCLVDTQRCLKLLDEALAHKAYEGSPLRLNWREKKAWIEMMTCEDKDFNAKVDAYLAVLSEDDPAIVKPEFKEEFTINQMNRLCGINYGNIAYRENGILPLVKKVRMRLPNSYRVQKAYYEAVLRYMWSIYGPTSWDHDAGMDGLSKECSFESQLAFIETGYKDPLLKGDTKFLTWAKVDRLTKLERFAEVEKLYNELAATTNVAELVNAKSRAADYWSNRAKRFYTKEWKPFLKNALDCFEVMEKNAAVASRNVYIANWRDRASDVAMRYGDAAIAKKWLDRRVKKDKDGKVTIVADDFANFRRGILAWDAKDYDGVIATMSKVSENYINREQLVGADRVAHYAKLAKAYDMKGMYAEELKALEVLKKKGGGTWKDYYAYVADTVKAKMAAAAK